LVEVAAEPPLKIMRANEDQEGIPEHRVSFGTRGRSSKKPQTPAPVEEEKKEEEESVEVKVPSSEKVQKNFKTFEILEVEQKINQAVKKLAKVEKVDYIKMNK